MTCHFDGCESNEWMARKFCRAHWQLIPPELQTSIRMMFAAKRYKVESDVAATLLDQARAGIATAIAQQSVTAEIGVFRTHMATVHALVAGIRTVPMRAVRDQLARSSESLLATDPELHTERRPHIDRDLAFLDFFADAADRLSEIIEAYPVPAKQDPTLVENAPEVDHNSQADGVASTEVE
jgi:hypothetical protein